MDKYKKLASDTIVFGIGNFGVKLIYFFLMPIYTMALSKEEFGLADLLSNGLSLLMPALTLSITDAVFRFTLDKGSNPSVLLSNGVRVLTQSYLVVLLFIGIVYIFVDLPVYWILIIGNYIFESLKSLFAQFTRALGKVWDFAANGIGSALVLLISTYILVYKLRSGVNGYILSFIIAELASIAFLCVRVPILQYIKIKAYDKDLLRQMLVFSVPLIPNMLSWWVTNISSRYIIAGFCGLGAAGLFASASKLPALMNVFSTIFQQSWQFASVKEYQESSKSSFYSKVFQQYSFLCHLVGSVMIAVVPFISKLVLQGEFYQAWVYTPLLLFSALLGCYSIFFGTFYAVVKDNVKSMYTTLIGASVNILICISIIPIIGVEGALIANVCSYAVIVLLRIKDVRKYITIEIEERKLFFGLSLCFSQAIIYMFSIIIGLIISVVSICGIVIINRKAMKALLIKFNIKR